MEQLSLLEPLRPSAKTAVWNTLDDQQKAAVIAALMRMIVQAASGAHTEPEHEHE